MYFKMFIFLKLNFCSLCVYLSLCVLCVCVQFCVCHCVSAEVRGLLGVGPLLPLVSVE